VRITDPYKSPDIYTTIFNNKQFLNQSLESIPLITKNRFTCHSPIKREQTGLRTKSSISIPG